jgi:hypothetical protein
VKDKHSTGIGCLYGNGQRQKKYYFYYETKNSKRSSPVQGISWRELQAAIFATTRSRQYRSCMEMTYITTGKE